MCFTGYYKTHMLRACGSDILQSMQRRCILQRETKASAGQLGAWDWPPARITAVDTVPSVERDPASSQKPSPHIPRIQISQSSLLESRIAARILNSSRRGSSPSRRTSPRLKLQELQEEMLGESSADSKPSAPPGPCPWRKARRAVMPPVGLPEPPKPVEWVPLRGGEDSTYTPVVLPEPVPPAKVGKGGKVTGKSLYRPSRQRNVLHFPLSELDLLNSDNFLSERGSRRHQSLGFALNSDGEAAARKKRPQSHKRSEESQRRVEAEAFASRNTSCPFRTPFQSASISDQAKILATAGGIAVQVPASSMDADSTSKSVDELNCSAKASSLDNLGSPDAAQHSNIVRLPPVKLGGLCGPSRFVAPATGVLSARGASSRASKHRNEALAAGTRQTVRARSVDR